MNCHVMRNIGVRGDLDFMYHSLRMSSVHAELRPDKHNCQKDRNDLPEASKFVAIDPDHNR